MKNDKYKGVFNIGFSGATHEIECYCSGFLQAFFILTAKAIEMGKTYQLKTIEREDGDIRYVDDILKCGNLLT